MALCFRNILISTLLFCWLSMSVIGCLGTGNARSCFEHFTVYLQAMLATLGSPCKGGEVLELLLFAPGHTMVNQR